MPTTPKAREITWRCINQVAVARSPMTGQSQVYAHPGQWWEVVVSLPPMPETAAWDWESLLIKLYGREGTFKLGPTTKTPRSTWSGTILVDALISQTFIRLQGGTGFVSRGDWLEIAGGLYRVVTGGFFDGDGELAVELWPRPRSGVVSGAAVNYTTPEGVFRLTENFEWNLDVARTTGINFAATEAL